MYLHLGENTVVNSRHIVAMIDLETATVSAITRAFLKAAQQSGIVQNVTDELPRSAVVCEAGGKRTVYISQISTGTLLKRAEKTEVLT